jgi:Cu/Ag efflux pump CusA
VGEAASGVKGENSVKLFGGDLEVLEKTASKIKDVMATVPGVQRARPRPRHHDVGGAEEG